MHLPSAQLGQQQYARVFNRHTRWHFEMPPDCGIILTGDFNQLHDMFLRTQYGFAQLVNTATRNSAILDKLWTNMDSVYDTPVVLDTLGRSDHRMVLLKPSCDARLDTGNIQRAVVRRFTTHEKAAFSSALSHVRWEHLYAQWGTIQFLPAYNRRINGHPLPIQVSDSPHC